MRRHSSRHRQAQSATPFLILLPPSVPALFTSFIRQQQRMPTSPTTICRIRSHAPQQQQQGKLSRFFVACFFFFLYPTCVFRAGLEDGAFSVIRASAACLPACRAGVTNDARSTMTQSSRVHLDGATTLQTETQRSS